MIVLKIYWKMIVAGIRAEMEYKATFLFMFFALIFYYTSQLTVILVILNRFHDIAGWTLGEMAFLYGMMVFSQGLTNVFFASLNDFESFMITGEFDRLLARPLNPLGQILAGKFGVSSIANFFIGITALWFGSVKAGVDWTVYKALFLPVVMVGAVLIQGGVRLAVTERLRCIPHCHEA